MEKVQTYPRLQEALHGHPTLRLLRHPHAYFILTFLHEVFKRDQILVIAGDELAGRLAVFLDHPGELDKDQVPVVRGTSQEKALHLLDLWCRDDYRFLRRFADEEGLVWAELTPYSERAFHWVDDLQESSYVGTESRFSEILRRVDDLIVGSSDDPEVRILRLEEKKRALDLEISQIRGSGKAEAFSDQQVEERFRELNRLSRELLGDFKQVEQNFKAIVKELYAKQSQQDLSRGDLLGYTLDATDRLRQTAQGQSFYAFWDFLIQDAGRESFGAKMDQIQSVLLERGLGLHDEVLAKLKTYLHQAGKRVIASNHLLAEKLNRLLTDRERKKRERTLRLIRDLKDLALKNPPQPGVEQVFMEIEGPPEAFLVMDRPLSEPPAGGVKPVKPSRNRQDIPTEALTALVNPFYVDRAKLRAQIQSLLSTQPSLTLGEILMKFPPEKGLSEVMAYFALAAVMPGAYVDSRRTLEVSLDHKKLYTPEVVFQNEF